MYLLPILYIIINGEKNNVAADGGPINYNNVGGASLTISVGTYL